MWIGWKAKFLTSHAAGLRPDRAAAILDDFIAKYPHIAEPTDAPQERQVEGHGFVEHPGDDG